MSDKNVINGENTSAAGENTSAATDEDAQRRYLQARSLEEKGKAQSSKLSDWPLIGYVEESNGDVLPIYRAVE